MKKLKWMIVIGVLPPVVMLFLAMAIILMMADSSADKYETEYESISTAQQLVDTAMSEYGTIGGDKYRLWYTGTADNQPWCAAFVSWCANECGLINTETLPRFQECNAGVRWFSGKDQFVYSRNYDDNDYIPKIGDIIFYTGTYSKDNATHVGIVQHIDDEYNVVAVEGNTSNGVFTRIYVLDDPFILGYATPNYPPETIEFTGNSNAEIAWNFFISQGCSEHAAAAILGNLERESPGIIPTVVEIGGGPGRGIAQWTVNGSRYNGLISFADEKGLDWTDLEVQLEYLWYEFSGGEPTTIAILNKSFGGLEVFKKANSIEWAVEVFEKSFERAGTPAIGNRIDNAYRYYNLYATTA